MYLSLSPPPHFPFLKVTRPTVLLFFHLSQREREREMIPVGAGRGTDRELSKLFFYHHHSTSLYIAVPNWKSYNFLRALVLFLSERLFPSYFLSPLCRYHVGLPHNLFRPASMHLLLYYPIFSYSFNSLLCDVWSLFFLILFAGDPRRIPWTSTTCLMILESMVNRSLRTALPPVKLFFLFLFFFWYIVLLDRDLYSEHRLNKWKAKGKKKVELQVMKGKDCSFFWTFHRLDVQGYNSCKQFFTLLKLHSLIAVNERNYHVPTLLFLFPSPSYFKWKE